MVPEVYEELHRLARIYLSRERSDHTLQPTELVNEAYIRLVAQREVNWRKRARAEFQKGLQLVAEADAVAMSNPDAQPAVEELKREAAGN